MTFHPINTAARAAGAKSGAVARIDHPEEEPHGRVDVRQKVLAGRSTISI